MGVKPCSNWKQFKGKVETMNKQPMMMCGTIIKRDPFGQSGTLWLSEKDRQKEVVDWEGALSQ